MSGDRSVSGVDSELFAEFANLLGLTTGKLSIPENIISYCIESLSVVIFISILLSS